MKIKTSVKAGGTWFNRSETARKSRPRGRLQLRTGVKAGGVNFNRCEALQGPEAALELKVKTSVRAGGMNLNRCETAGKSKVRGGVQVRTSVKAGGFMFNRCEPLAFYKRAPEWKTLAAWIVRTCRASASYVSHLRPFVPKPFLTPKMNSDLYRAWALGLKAAETHPMLGGKCLFSNGSCARSWTPYR